ncbi:MAG: Hsp20/alpha crystallin family protein [Xanthomonadales bacterium]|nr:Hsp20/alpha crystallin family protein [Xanthomonadales bacterium]
MDIKKLAPWNWFKDEEAEQGEATPVQSAGRRGDVLPWSQVHDQIDQLFDQAFRGFGLSAGQDSLPGWKGGDVLLKPSVDIGATNDRYTITVEVPGVEEGDVSLELDGDRLTIRGEKHQEAEDRQKDFYRVERSYGAFRRVLTLPKDADPDAIDARFRNGVLKISMPRNAEPQSQGRVIEIQNP